MARSPSPNGYRSRSRSRSRGRSYYSRSPAPRRSASRSRSPSRASASRSPVSRRNGRQRDSRSPSPLNREPAGRGRSRSRSESPAQGTKVSFPARGFAPRLRSPVGQIVVEKLTKNVNEEHLHEIFGEYGQIRDMDLPIGRFSEYSGPHEAATGRNEG